MAVTFLCCSMGSSPGGAPPPSPWQAGGRAAVRGMFSGLIIGMLWGVWEENKYVLWGSVRGARQVACQPLAYSG